MSTMSCTSYRNINKIDEGKIFDWIYQIPELNDITVNGDDSDWANQGLELFLPADNNGDAQVDTKFYPIIKIAWNKQGLFLGFWVKVDSVTSVKSKPWQGDSIEIFVTDGMNGLNHIQFAIPAIFNNNNKVGPVYIVNNRGDRKISSSEIKYLSAGKREQKGYFVEFMMPFSNINMTPGLNKEIALNFKINHLGNRTSPRQVEWHPIGGSNTLGYRRFMNRVVLSDKSGPTPQAIVKNYVLDNHILKIHIISDKATAGEKITVKQGKNIFDKQLKLVESNSLAEFSIELPKNKSKYERYKVYFNNELIEDIDALESNLHYDKIKKINFLNKVNRYLAEDKSHQFPKGNILFTGHSQIDFWDQIHDDMKPFKVLNRGMGGAKADTILRFLDELVFKHEPTIVIYYIGGNDLNVGRKPQAIANDIKIFCTRVHEKLPNTQICLIGNPIRASYSQEKKDAYKMIEEEQLQLAKDRNYVCFVNIADKLLIKNGEIPAKFLKLDNTHYSAEGYQAFAPIIHSQINEVGQASHKQKKKSIRKNEI